MCDVEKRNRGYFEIGVWHPKTEQNIGTLWRSAYQLGASGIFTIGRRYQKQASDTCSTFKHVALRNYENLDELFAVLPYSAPLVAIEMGGKPLEKFWHPERAVYLLGAEDHGLPDVVLSRCHMVVSLNCVRVAFYNVAVAGSIVMYHRLMQNG